MIFFESRIKWVALLLMMLIVVVGINAKERLQPNLIQHISKSKVLIEFIDATKEEKQDILFNLSFVDGTSAVFLTRPNIAIVKIKPQVREKGIAWLIEQVTGVDQIKNLNPIFSIEGKMIALLSGIFVKIQQPAELEILKELITNYNIPEPKFMPYLHNVAMLSIDKKSGIGILALLDLLRLSDRFEYVEPNILFNLEVSTNDPLFQRQWSITNDGSNFQWNGTPGADMSVEDAWTLTMGDSAIKVGILDSGVDTLHPEFDGQLLAGFDATGGGSKGYPNLTFNEDAHGTACAGIVVAKANNGMGIAGVAPDCRVVPVKVFVYSDTLGNTVPFSTSQWMATGIGWANNVANVDIMSNSWGIPQILFGFFGPIELVEDAIDDANENGRGGKGIPQLFSSGNDDGKLLWPSSLEGTIAVTATSMCDERKNPNSCDGESWGGNFGEGLDVGAPGVKISTTDIFGRKGYNTGNYTNTFNGTSAACPNAAAVVALILSVRPDFTGLEARQVLASSADDVGGYDYSTIKYAGSWSAQLGFGRVNANSAIITAMNFTGIEELHENDNSKIVVFPNPLTNNKLVLRGEVSSVSPEIKIDLYSINGVLLKQLQNIKLTGSVFELQIDMSAFSNGIYILRGSVAGESFLKKIVKIKN